MPLQPNCMLVGCWLTWPLHERLSTPCFGKNVVHEKLTIVYLEVIDDSKVKGLKNWGGIRRKKQDFDVRCCTFLKAHWWASLIHSLETSRVFRFPDNNWFNTFFASCNIYKKCYCHPLFALLAPFAQLPFLSQAFIRQCLPETACFIHVQISLAL